MLQVVFFTDQEFWWLYCLPPRQMHISLRRHTTPISAQLNYHPPQLEHLSPLRPKATAHGIMSSIHMNSPRRVPRHHGSVSHSLANSLPFLPPPKLNILVLPT